MRYLLNRLLCGLNWTGVYFAHLPGHSVCSSTDFMFPVFSSVCTTCSSRISASSLFVHALILIFLYFSPIDGKQFVLKVVKVGINEGFEEDSLDGGWRDNLDEGFF